MITARQIATLPIFHLMLSPSGLMNRKNGIPQTATKKIESKICFKRNSPGTFSLSNVGSYDLKDELGLRKSKLTWKLIADNVSAWGFVNVNILCYSGSINNS